jgi:hypothetical protein
MGHSIKIEPTAKKRLDELEVPHSNGMDIQKGLKN